MLGCPVQNCTPPTSINSPTYTNTKTRKLIDLVVPRQKKKKKKMARYYSPKITTAIFLAAAALCLVSLAGSAYAHEPHFTVEGKVYCDTCNIQFITKLTEYIPGARVRLECRDREGGSLTYSQEALTDATGTYRLEVDGDHEEEICEVIPLESSVPECNGISEGEFLRKAFRVSLTSNNGVLSPFRQVNPLGFLKKESLPGCIDVLKELGFTETGALLP